MNHPFTTPLASVLGPLALTLGLAFASGAGSFPAHAAQDAEIRRHPGFVDGSAFVTLAGEDSELVEVTLGSSLLKAISRGSSDEPHAQSVLSGLLGVNAYVVDLAHDASREARADKMIKEIAAKVEASGWERLVRLREKGEVVNVYVRNNDETIDGLVVLVFDRDDSEVVFANLVGTIDLARLGELDGSLKVPGLDAIGETETSTPGEKSSESKGQKPGRGETPRAEGIEEAL